ncbi:MAG: T9SS type A sorting domain-containing protein, partial [Bacteroidales bacterium]
NPHTAQSVQVSIYNIFGKLFLRQSFPSSIRRMDVNLENLPSGVYFISIEAGVEQVQWEKLLISH